jgi:hypothetical protein
MKKIRTTLLINFIFLGLFFVLAHTAHADIIHDFSSTINVLPDSSILVNENINYDFEKNIRHGIFRDILLTNSKKEPITINVVSVTNEKKEPYIFDTEISNGILRIKIGDPNEMISGIKEYDITYKVLGSIVYYQDFDELYWNVTGNNWDVTIEKAEAKVVLPNNVFPTQESCYYGVIGSKTNCLINQSGIFETGSTLGKNEGLTVAVGFPKGAVLVYQPKVESKITKIVKTFWPVIIPIAVFVFMYIRWLKKGKDPRGTEVIIPQYDVPDNLTPLEVGAIVNGRLKDKNISAEIIYLATEGYLKVKQIDCDNDNFLCLISKKDYQLTLLKEKGLLTNDFDKKVLTAIFGEKGKVGGIVKLSGLKNHFYKLIPSINNSLIDNLLSKKYFTNFPKLNARGLLPIIITVVLVLFVSFSLSLFINFFVFVFAILTTIIIGFIFYRLMPAKSKDGVSKKEYLLGLKEYLQIAEKDRLVFHNAPEKRPEIFEKLLPYAMVFGVEGLWAKEFKEIYNNPPSWYEGQIIGFNAVSFSHEMAMFSTIVSSSFSSTPSGSGSSGAGFSGGGGGGGGGGGW